MHPIPAHALSLLLFFSALVAAANFKQCLEDFRKSDPSTIGGVDPRGNPTSPAKAVGLTYETCVALCGLDSERFKWKGFARLFSSWLLPWLALTSQLPFGSGNYLDDFLSIVMSVGSPALAAYSLALTSLNARSVYRRAQRMKHESRAAVARTLITLQQTPLELTKDERLLAFIPIDDQWRREIVYFADVSRLSRRNAWPIVTVPPVLWAVIAFTLALVDSLVSVDGPASGEFQGHAVGALWLWLLCLVIGWWWVPTFTYGELKSVVDHANETAAKKAVKRIKQNVTAAYNSAKTRITNRLPKRMSTPKGSKEPAVDLPEVPEGNESGQVRGESIQEEDIEPAGQETEPKINLLLNPTYHQSTVPFQSTGSQQGHGLTSPSAPNLTADQSATSLSRSDATHSIAAQSLIHPDTDRLLIPKNDLGSLNRDELRLAATFNYSRIMRYLVLVDDVLRALDKLTDERGRIPEATTTQPAGKVVFPPGALTTMFNASIFALILQCGTTIAAVIIMVFTPTIGLGCRSLGYLINGGTALLILFLTIVSTVLARISETRHEQSTIVKSLTAFIAIALRRISLLLAFINTTGLIVMSCFQFSYFLRNCYCNASVIGRGTDSYAVASYEGWVSTMRNARIVGTVLAVTCMAIYMTSLWLMSALPAEIRYL